MELLKNNENKMASKMELNSPTSTSSETDGETDRHFVYSEIYSDDQFDYRHVEVPPKVKLKRPLFMSEAEWRALGVCMSPGWEHYAWHRPEPRLLLFRRPKKN